MLAHLRRLPSQRAPATTTRTERVITIFFQAGISLLYGSLSLSLGKTATSVRVSPNGMPILAVALTAQPFALRRGAMFLLRSLSQARIIAGPEITSIIPTKRRISSHQSSSASPLATDTNAVPIIPRAIPKAANIPANLAMSNGGAAVLAASAFALAGRAAGAALILVGC